VKNKLLRLLCLVAIVVIFATGCDFPEFFGVQAPPVSLDDIPEFDGSTPYVIINDNIPFFTDEKCDKSYESFSPLDSLGRCGVAISCIGTDIMPTEERESISHITPSGWRSINIDGQYVYNRCHLIGFQLTGENDNEANLITGTRYMNVTGMLPFENLVADYVKDTENHVLYRVTPIYDGYDLVAKGVLMEAKSIEDDDVLFCVYVYNNQPGLVIDYGTGEVRRATDSDDGENKNDGGGQAEKTYILNTSSKKFHLENCKGASSISDSNKSSFTGKREDLIEQGYTPCGICDP
jgi:DNA-entry nuclease